jgi:hypothetical protein
MLMMSTNPSWKEKFVLITLTFSNGCKNPTSISLTDTLEESVKRKHASPYFDGETMLCLAKAAKYLDGYSDLILLIKDTSMTLAKKYTVDSWRDDTHVSNQTKGFYQWSSMFLAEYHNARWKDYEIMGNYVVALAH